MRKEGAAQAGLTPRELARLLRVSPDRIRAMIGRGELRAVNMARTRCGAPRWVILPDALAAFVKGRQAAPSPAPSKRKKQMVKVDYYPD